MPKKSKKSRSKSKKSTKPARLHGWVLAWHLSQALAISMMLAILAFGLALNIHDLQTPSNLIAEYGLHDTQATRQLRALSGQVSSFEAAEQTAGIHVVPNTSLEQQLAEIEIKIEVRNHRSAMTGISTLSKQLGSYQDQLNKLIEAKQTADRNQSVVPGHGTASGTFSIPILMYHKTPSNFSTQLDLLTQKGYHAITMSQVAAGLHGAALPAKPVAITFDDGFADQMNAFAILLQHHMVATYYIIDGGPNSRWCIGAGRRYNDPLQPPEGCGDAYLSWDQVRQLDASGLITIASHTIDHPDLATESPDQQRYEIIEGKHQLEDQIGHPVADFAYPYGSFNATTIQIVQQAGFRTAVTTTPGLTQTLGGIYTLRRIRDPSVLP